jgi:hypothetical protein
VAASGEPMRSIADFPMYTPKWASDLLKRISKLEQGKMHDIVLIMPDDGSEPTWVVRGSAKLENSR